MHSTAELLTFAVGVFSATLDAFLAFYGFVPGGEGKAMNRVYTALGLVAAWYCFWVGTVHSGMLPSPNLLCSSQLLTGAIGPLLLLFSLALTDLHFRVPRFWPVVFVGMAPGVVMSLATLSMSGPDAEAMLAGYRQTHAFAPPLQNVLFKVHTALMVGFIVSALVVLLVRLARPPHAQARSRAVLGLLPVAMTVVGLFFTNLLPLISETLRTASFGPLASVPAVAMLAVAFRRTRLTLAALEEQRSFMQSYLPKEIVERITQGTHTLELGGQEAVATVLFSDLRGFTTLSTELPAKDVVRFLNHYFERMNEVVFRHQGMIDKFIGDAILAVFGVPEKSENDADRAVACGREMLVELEAVNRWWAAQGHAPVKIGVGMDRGPLVHGNVGSPTRMEYTVIGDTVNSASRVEGLTKELGAPIVFTQAVLEGLSARPGDLAELGTRTLRGRKGETRLFGVGAPVRHPLDDAGPSDPRLAKLVLTRDSDPSTSE